jgi:para-aminobenzoate synthetase/4-amino-4-deoxychorismate lyase
LEGDSIEALIQIDNGGWLSLDHPARIVEAWSVDRVRAALADVERLTRDAGYHAAGFVSYEAGAAFGLPSRPGHDADLPLVWFALFEPESVRHLDGLDASEPYVLGPLTPSLDRARFEAAFDRIKNHLAQGDTYQVNFTFRVRGPFQGDARHLFADLVEAQQGRYSAFLRTGSHAICSASPELFFSLSGLEVSARPMKGTLKRGTTLADDRSRRDELRSSAKQRAENVMIVDMVRNDLGRIAEVGSVRVHELFTVERYPNVWQMTSLVTARSGAALQDVFAALHPSASVTGAPKFRTMELLNMLETQPRGVYTGAIGHVWPDGSVQFNVAIRTAVVNDREGSVEFGIGSGIVWDSDSSSEYDECLLKASVLGRRPIDFELIETLRWTKEGGFFLLARHLQRLAESAEYFNIACSPDHVRAVLSDAVRGADGPLRVRLLLSRAGRARVEHRTLERSHAPLRVALAEAPIDRDDPFLFHKTTNRAMFERAKMDGCDDVILWNRAGQVTETTTANIVADIGGAAVTPPVGCGLLAGTYRAELLARGELREGLITIADLAAAKQLWLINSVHERRPAVLTGTSGERS